MSDDQPMHFGHQRVLIFGGTFDPPHIAHARLPAQAAEQLDCDLILYIPAAINPLKSSGPQVSREHRLAMLLLAIADLPMARISTIELDRADAGGGPSYTIDTLRSLREEYPDSTEFRLLIGCDQALDFHRWKNWQDIIQLAAPAVMVRPPWDVQGFRTALFERYATEEAERWVNWTLRLPLIDANATEIRQQLVCGNDKAVARTLDPAVLNYIQAHRLYR